MTTNKPVLLNCPACGAPLDFDGTSPVIRCKFCGNRSLVDGGEMDQPSENSSALGVTCPPKTDPEQKLEKVSKIIQYGRRDHAKEIL